MRKITDNAVNAFNLNKPFKSSNTEVKVENNIVDLYLFGHKIASKMHNKMLITNCGYFTNTTKERLNGLPNVRIQQKKGIWYLNGKEWDGKLIEVK